MKTILGISGYYHDSAAAVVCNGQIVAAAQEERFTRKKHDASFPANSIRFCLAQAGIEPQCVDAVVFYDKPFLTFERILETQLSFAPRGFNPFRRSMPLWLKEKLFLKGKIRTELQALWGSAFHQKIFFSEHHLSHAASAFFPSPFEDAAILTVDGVGEWATSGIFHGQGIDIKKIFELEFPHSWGLFYSAFTYFLGFKVNSGEYKLMGLAPYGDPNDPQTQRYIEIIEREIVTIFQDGSIQLNMNFFEFAVSDRMIATKRWEKLFGLPRREQESTITKSQANLAYAAQFVLEKGVLAMAREARIQTGSRNLVLAGGVALNCVANSKIRASNIFEHVWAQPAADDSGGALGAALGYSHVALRIPRPNPSQADQMKGSFLGPEYHDNEILAALDQYQLGSTNFPNTQELVEVVAQRLSEGNVVGWFQGKMEWGPRSLGNRSILASATLPSMQKKINLKIKFREGFRPFAPSVLSEDAAEYFEITQPSPYMLFTANLKSKWQKQLPIEYRSFDIGKQLELEKSEFPAITHVDLSARVQTVHKDIHGKFWELLQAYKRVSGHSILVNTSFNVRGEPIVCTPDEAIRCFVQTDMDVLVMGSRLLEKAEVDSQKLSQLKARFTSESAQRESD